MPRDDLPPRADVDEINLRITDGLRSCRSIVANYRAMITGTNDNLPEERAANDEQEVAAESGASEA